MAKILVVDDHKNTRLTLSEILKREGHSVLTAATGRLALGSIEREQFDIVVTDLKLGDIDGIEVVSRVKQSAPGTNVVVITAFGSVATAVRAMKLGALDYITKPLDREKILSIVDQALKSVHQKNSRSEVPVQKDDFQIFGQDQRILELTKLAREVARSDVPILLTGESGTGKELIAKFVHWNSNRAQKPFVAINCGALPEALQESELFGHVKGAFTGAIQSKKGLFEAADGGTVLLDEIGEMTPPTQVKLLRVLQDGEIRPVGSNETVHIDVRIISSTNRELTELAKQGRFREDLLFRINAVILALPRLVERGDDVLVLSDHFVRKYNVKYDKEITQISGEARDKLRSYEWPGNIRELENCIRRAVILCKTDMIEPADLEQLSESKTRNNSKSLLIDQEKNLIQEALTRTKWNRKQAALELGIGATTLWRKIKKFGLREPSA